MPYTPQYILVQGQNQPLYQSTGACGMPTTFSYFLCSIWVCLGDPHSAASRIVSVGGPQGFGSVNIVYGSVGVTLLNNIFSNIFGGNFSVAINNLRSHVLVSVDSLNQIVQVYVNDVAVPQSSGAGWSGVGPFNISYFPQWTLSSSGSTLPGCGVADCFIAAPAAFYDISLTGNRRRFINADLTAVDLGNDGSEVLGTKPPVFLTVRPTSSNPADFIVNNGFGGAWSASTGYAPSFEPAGLGCVAPTPPPPPPPSPGSLAMDNVLALDLTPANVADTQIFLMWSNDRGHSYGSPVGQPIGAPGAYLTSPQWQRLSYARDRVFKLEWSVPVATALLGAYIDVDAQAKS